MTDRKFESPWEPPEQQDDGNASNAGGRLHGSEGIEAGSKFRIHHSDRSCRQDGIQERLSPDKIMVRRKDARCQGRRYQYLQGLLWQSSKPPALERRVSPENPEFDPAAAREMKLEIVRARIASGYYNRPAHLLELSEILIEKLGLGES